MRWFVAVGAILLATVAGVALAQVAGTKMVQPQYAYALFNLLLVIVIGLIAWLMKRAIQGVDSSVNKASDKLDNLSAHVNELRVQIVGDYITRKEHSEQIKHLENLIDQHRENIHKLRDQTQTMVNKITFLEALHEKEK